ncbi:cytochrome P450 CYP5099A1 [Mariannaea sp. PMI_226]|nr:cytochrome P450 CYP5099A1 [Mariannaea sp. PMI_226]
MGSFFLLLLALPAILFCCFLWHTSLPKRFPRNIPIISIYVRVYDNIRGVTETDFYNARVRKHIEKYGAVGLWFEGQWAVVVAKPEYICQVLRDKTSSLTRHGFYRRVPGSIGAELFGENIIDSDGELHEHFSQIIKPGIQRRHDFASLIRKSSQLATVFLQLQSTMTNGDGVAVSQLIFQWSVSVYGEYFLDVEFDLLNFSKYNIQAILEAQNRSVIGRLKTLFPILDKLPWTWSVTRRTRKRFNDWEAMLMEHAARGLERSPLPGHEDKIIHRMNGGRLDGNLSDFHYKSNMKQLFIAGAENAEAVLISAMLELAKHGVVQEQLHSEVMHDLPADYSESDLKRLPLLSAVIYETLRLYPPLAFMRNRRTNETYQLGHDILIPAGALIGRHVYGVQTDPAIWHDAGSFKPERWGSDIATVNSTFRREQANGRFVPFGLHSRRCLGSSFAIHQLRIAVCELVRVVQWRLSPDYKFSFSRVCLSTTPCFELSLT